MVEINTLTVQINNRNIQRKYSIQYDGGVAWW